MKKASEYQQHAEECRQLAAKMESGEQRELLLTMAANWDRLAQDREYLLERRPELREEVERAKDPSG